MTHAELLVVAHDVLMWIEALGDCYLCVSACYFDGNFMGRYCFAVFTVSIMVERKEEREREVLHWPSSVIEDYSSCVRVCTRVCAPAWGWEGMVCRHSWWDIVDNLNQLVGQTALLWNSVDMIGIGADDLKACCWCISLPQMIRFLFYFLSFIHIRNLTFSVKRLQKTLIPSFLSEFFLFLQSSRKCALMVLFLKLSTAVTSRIWAQQAHM